MYFPLEVNEQLATAMRAAAAFKIEVEKIIECVCVDECSTVSDEQNDYMKMGDNICDMMCTLGKSIGMMLTEMAIDEVRKANPRNNQNPESHVSE